MPNWREKRFSVPSGTWYTGTPAAIAAGRAW